MLSDSLCKTTRSADPNLFSPLGISAPSPRLTVGRYFYLLGGNFKQALVQPFHMQKKDWKYLSVTALLAGGLSFGDEPVQRFALRLRTENQGLQKASGFVTNFGDRYELYTLGAFGAYSFLFKKERMQTTTLLASQAFVTSSVLVSALKFLTVRTRPSYYQQLQEAEPYFLGPFVGKAGYNGDRTNTSFPSGHTASVFAVATVFAKEYRDRRWVPALAYGAATLVGLSRITENKHWATDVFAGAALGYVTGLQAVNSYHRRFPAKAAHLARHLNFNLQYSRGSLVPGLIYKI